MADRMLDEVRRELYRADPGEFIDVRDRRVAEARERGDDELAAAIKKLRKPTTAAWAVNALASDDPQQVDSLIDLGEQLRSAQRNLHGDEIRRLSGRRSQLLRELTDAAAASAGRAGHSLGEQARQQVEQTLSAALSDPDAAQAVREGTLSKPLEYSGFGLDELSVEAIRRSGTKAPKTGPTKTGPTKTGPTKTGPPKAPRKDQDETTPPKKGGAKKDRADKERADKERARRGKLEAEVTDAREELDRVEDDLRLADQDLRDAESDRDEAQRRRSELREELDRLERELRTSDRDVTRARRRRDRAQRQRESIEKRVRDLERKLESED